MNESRRKGLDTMNEVFGWDMPDMPGDYFGLTADHLFGVIWARPGLSIRDKRIMTLTVLTALGQQDQAEVHVNAAMLNGELTEVELNEMAIFLAHYVGFPLVSQLVGVITKVAPKHTKSAPARTAAAGKAITEEGSH